MGRRQNTCHAYALYFQSFENFGILFGQDWGVERILGHVASSCLNMSPYRTRFKSKPMIFVNLNSKSTYLNFNFPEKWMLNPQEGGRLDAKGHCDYVI